MDNNKRLVEIWRANPFQQLSLRREWPEMAELLEDVIVAVLYHESMLATGANLNIDVQNGLRYILESAGVSEGLIEKTLSCDGCKTIDRMRKNLPKNDETAAYEFQRAAKHHRKECPNR